MSNGRVVLTLLVCIAAVFCLSVGSWAWINVKDSPYFAAGDGVTDDTSAIQDALDNANGDSVYLPTGRYRITSPLDLTNLSSGGLTLCGNAWAYNGQAGSVIVGDTGGVVFDCTGSQFLTFRNFSVVTGTNDPSTCGFLFARSQTSQYAQFNKMENVTVRIESDPDAYSDKGTVGVYNWGAEIMHISDCYLLADTPLVVSYSNEWEIDSPCTDLIESTVVSTSQIVVDGGNATLYSLDDVGFCLYLGGVMSSDFKNIFFAGYPSAAITMGVCNNVNVSGHKESTGPVAILGNMDTNSSIRMTTAVGSQSPFVANPNEYVSISNMDLTVLATDSPSASYFYDSPYTNVLYACKFTTDWVPATSWTQIDANAHFCTYTVNGVSIHHGESAAPTSGYHYYGEIVYNSAPAYGGYIGWVCTASGTPGTWRPFGKID